MSQTPQERPLPARDPLAARLEAELGRLFDARLSPAEIRLALDEFLAAARIDEETAGRLESRLPEVPRGFYAKWIGRFAAQAAREQIPERLELMARGDRQGLMLALVEFFEFLEEHAVEVREDLRDMARSAGLLWDDLLLAMEAESSFVERRLRGA